MRKSKILVVDDECGFTHLLKHVLFRYEIMEVNDSQRALETARQFKPDLILLDVIMPGLDGGDLATQLKSDPTLKRVPIVFLTAIVSPKEAGHGSRMLGGYPFLSKPIRAEDLIHCLEEQLAGVA
jgi:two-component system OmpR family response regulator